MEKKHGINLSIFNNDFNFVNEYRADGSKYEGMYKEGKKHGNGTYTWSDGSKY